MTNSEMHAKVKAGLGKLPKGSVLDVLPLMDKDPETWKPEELQHFTLVCNWLDNHAPKD